MTNEKIVVEQYPDGDWDFTLYVGGVCFQTRYSYSSRASVLRAAKRVAKRLGLEVESGKPEVAYIL